MASISYEICISRFLYHIELIHIRCIASESIITLWDVLITIKFNNICIKLFKGPRWTRWFKRKARAWWLQWNKRWRWCRRLTRPKRTFGEFRKYCILCMEEIFPEMWRMQPVKCLICVEFILYVQVCVLVPLFFFKFLTLNIRWLSPAFSKIRQHCINICAQGIPRTSSL